MEKGKSWKEFDQLKDIDQKYNWSDYYDVNKYGIKCGTSLRFWEDKGWINKIDPYGWFQWCFMYWLGRRLKDDKRQINRWKKIVSTFRSKLVKIIRNTGSKYDNYAFHLKLDKCYYIGVMNYQKNIFLVNCQINI